MGLLDQDNGDNHDSTEEVEISAQAGSEKTDSDLMDEVETKFGSAEETEVDNSSQGSIDLEDIHRQNKKIISLLEDINENNNDQRSSSKNSSSSSQSDMIGGDMNGVL